MACTKTTGILGGLHPVDVDNLEKKGLNPRCPTCFPGGDCHSFSADGDNTPTLTLTDVNLSRENSACRLLQPLPRNCICCSYSPSQLTKYEITSGILNMSTANLAGPQASLHPLRREQNVTVARWSPPRPVHDKTLCPLNGSSATCSDAS